MAEIRWRVYYDDGSTFDSSQGSPADSPGWGVVACISAHEVEGCTFQSLSDYYDRTRHLKGFSLKDLVVASKVRRYTLGTLDKTQGTGTP